MGYPGLATVTCNPSAWGSRDQKSLGVATTSLAKSMGSKFTVSKSIVKNYTGKYSIIICGFHAHVYMCTYTRTHKTHAHTETSHAHTHLKHKSWTFSFL